MANDRVHLQRKAAEPAATAGRGAAGDRIAGSPAMLAQRKQIESTFGAAQLAAYHSKAQAASGKVDVHVCRVADVRKHADAPPGQVTLKRWEVVKVYADNGQPVQYGERLFAIRAR